LIIITSICSEGGSDGGNGGACGGVGGDGGGIGKSMSVAARFSFAVVVPITAVGGDGSPSFVFCRPMTRSPSLNAARLNCSSNDTSRNSGDGGVGGDRRR